MARDTTAEAPIPIPSARLPIVSTTGKVNESAASCSRPRRPTKKVSARLYTTMLRIPKIIGRARRISVLPTGSCSSRARLIWVFIMLFPRCIARARLPLYREDETALRAPQTINLSNKPRSHGGALLRSAASRPLPLRINTTGESADHPGREHVADNRAARVLRALSRRRPCLCRLSG